jgi:hypothetical protein
MWTTWLERILGQRPANENEPVAAAPAVLTEPASDQIQGTGDVFAVKPVNAAFGAGHDEAKAKPEDELEVMP